MISIIPSAVVSSHILAYGNGNFRSQKLSLPGAKVSYIKHLGVLDYIP